MGSRWTDKEKAGLIEMRRRLSEELANIPQFPEGTNPFIFITVS